MILDTDNKSKSFLIPIIHFLSLLIIFCNFESKFEYIFSITIPAKVQSYLACGKPILAMVNGEVGKVVVDAKAGFSCAAESPHELVQNILKMKTMREKDLSEMGENARKYYNDNFERSYLFDKAENIFRTMCESF